MSHSSSDGRRVVQQQSEFRCECGSHFVKLADGTSVCAKTVERFKVRHGYDPLIKQSEAT